MATVNSNTSNGYYLQLVVSQSSQSISNNTSSLSWTLYFKNGTKYYQNSSTTDNFKVVINGTTVYNTSRVISFSGANKTLTIASGSLTVTHGSDGSKSVNMSCSYSPGKSASYYPGSLSGSGSMTLTTIPRASSISGLTGNVTINGANGLEVYIDRKSNSFTHTVTFGLGNYSQSFYGVDTYQWLTVPIIWLNVLSSASSATGWCSVTTYNGSTQIGSSVTSYFTAYRPSASTLSLSPSSVLCDGLNAIGVSISRVNGEFTHTVTWTFGNYSNSVGGIGTSTSYVVPQSWLNAIPDTVSGTGTVTVTTYYGNIQLGSNSATFTLNVPSHVIPSLLSVTTSIINPNTITDWDIYVKNISNCKLTINANGTFGSSISKIYVNNVSTNNPYVDTALNASGTRSYSVYVTDSRGRTSNTIVKTINIVDYAIPTLKVNTISRCLVDGTFDDEGTYVVINATYTMASCSGKNALTRMIEHKDTTASYYTEDGSFDTDLDIIIDGFEINKTYDFIISVMDTVGKTAIYTGDGIIPTSTAIIDILNGGKGIAFGKMASEEDIIDCAWGIKTPALYDEDGRKVPLGNILVFIEED